jgi:hypothetical protein
MKTFYCILLSLLILCCFEAPILAQTLGDDVSPYECLIEGNLDCLPLGTNIPIIYSFRNLGINDEFNIKTFVVASDHSGNIIYRDSAVIDTLMKGMVKGITFKNFIISRRIQLVFNAYSAMESDEDRTNDTISRKVLMVPETDPKAVAVISPADDTAIISHSQFKLIGCFINGGATDIYDLPVQTQIFRCSDHQLIFRSDTTIEALYIDTSAVAIPFPIRAGSQDLSILPPGCYQIAVICKKSDDGDRTNDTAYSKFSIVSKPYEHDISVSKILSPQSSGNSFPTSPLPVKIRITNPGANSESAVSLTVTISLNGKNVYQDVSVQSTFVSGEIREITLKEFIPASIGIYTLSAVLSLSSDQYSANNILTSSILIENAQNEDNVATDSLLFLANGQRVAIMIPMPIKIRYVNKGTRDEVNVKVKVNILNPNGKMAYSDSTIIPVLNRGQSKVITYPDFTPTKLGAYNICGITLLNSDQSPTDDTVCGTVISDYDNDVVAISVENPLNGDSILMGQPIEIIGSFKIHGLKDDLNIPIRVQARSCQPKSPILFQADTSINVLHPDSPSVTINFPTQQGNFDIRNLPAGCYNIYVIALNLNDGDRTNDTALSTFIIFSKLSARVLPESYISLSQNSPNPFSNSTTISYTLPDDGEIILRIFDVTGRVIESQNGFEEAGEHKRSFNLENLPNGIYTYELVFTQQNEGSRRISRKMVVLK